MMDTGTLNADEIRAEAAELFGGRPRSTASDHAAMLGEVLDALEPLDFRAAAGVRPGDPVSLRTQIVLTVAQILAKTRELNLGLAKNLDFVFAFNGEFWQRIDAEALENFLAEAAFRVGMERLDARWYETRRKLVQQFFADAWLPRPEPATDRVLINVGNGTLVIGAGPWKTERRISSRCFASSL